MKNFRSIILLLSLLTLGLSACQKPIDFPEGSGPGGTKKTISAFFKAKVNGVWVECNITTVQLYNTPNPTIQISAFKGATDGFTIALQDYTGVGDYSLGSLNTASYVNDFKNPFSNNFIAEKGNVKITSANAKTIKGTFEFSGFNIDGNATKEITEGSFELSLETPIAPTPGDNDKNLSTKVDGTPVSFIVAAAGMVQTPLGKTISIAGVNGTKTISIAIFDYTGPGTYALNDLAQVGYNQDQSQTGSFLSTSGKVVVNSYINGVIKGTFECVAPNEDSSLNTKVTLTEGKFEAKLQQ
ncbi:DUF6252 family protein [Pedobacter sp. ASV12]|uniref:DUF6252 family protein n=1 Tax=Pedobacter sp. ASV12 TaxID=2795120 RepID=UPI0018EE1E97|nr:DUF6252 family protein [Pedobacter sp. ASV12]